MAIDWKQPKNLKVVLLLAAAAAIFLAIGILLRAPEPPPPSPDPETPIAQLEERVMPSALRRHGEFLAQRALRQTASLAYSAELESTVVVLNREGWAVATAARVPAERETEVLRHDGTLSKAEIQAADLLHNLYLLRFTSPRPGVPIAPEDDPSVLRPGVRLFAAGLNHQGQLSLVNGELSEPVGPEDTTLAFTGPLTRGSLGSILVTLDETVLGLLVRQGNQIRVWNWKFVAEVVAHLRRAGFHAHPDLGVTVGGRGHQLARSAAGHTGWGGHTKCSRGEPGGRERGAPRGADRPRQRTNGSHPGRIQGGRGSTLCGLACPAYPVERRRGTHHRD